MEGKKIFSPKTMAILTITLTVYAGLAYFVSMGVSHNMWSNSPPGSLFPIPSLAGGSYVTVFSEMSLVDEFIYVVFIKTGLLALLTIGMWIYFFILFKRKNITK